MDIVIDTLREDSFVNLDTFFKSILNEKGETYDL